MAFLPPAISGASRPEDAVGSGENRNVDVGNADQLEHRIVDDGERTAEATAATECDLLVIDHRDVIPFLERRGDLCILLLRVPAQRLRQTDQFVEETLFEQVGPRLANALLRVTSDHNGAMDGKPLTLFVSQEELARMIGSTRESGNKQLQVWQRSGLVELGKRLIVIRDPAALEEHT